MKKQKTKMTAAICLILGTLAWTQAQAQSVVNITSGDPGGGFAPLSVDVNGVEFGTSSVTIQGVTFNSGSPTQISGGDSGGDGTYSGYSEGAFSSSFTPADANNTSMLSLLDGFEYDYGSQYSNLSSPTATYTQYQFTGLTVGQTYQLDLFTVADSNPRYTLTQVAGATTLSDDINTLTTPQDIVYDMTPNLSGDIAVDWAWGTGTDAGSSGNSGLISGIAITEAPEPSTVALLSAGLCLLLVSMKRRHFNRLTFRSK